MKHKLLKVLYVLTAFLLIFSLMTGCAGKNTVATVGKNSIGLNFYKVLFGITANQISQSMGITDFTNAKIGNENAMDYTKKSALDSAHLYKIEIMLANEKGMSLTQDDKTEIEQQKQDLISQSGGLKAADDTVRSGLGVGLEDYIKVIEELTLANKYRQQALTDMVLTDEDVKAAYDKDPEEYRLVEVRHILFATVDLSTGAELSEEAKAIALENAEETMKKIKDGEDMVTLADQLSEDTGVKQNHGLYQVSKYSNFMSEFLNWSIDPTRNVNDLEIVETDYGYHVMRFEKIYSFDELKEEIKYDVQALKYSELIEGWKAEDRFKLVINENVYNSITLPL